MADFSVANPGATFLSTLAGIEDVENRKAVRDLRKAQAQSLAYNENRSNRLVDLTGLALQGDPEARQALEALSPERAKQVFELGAQRALAVSNFANDLRTIKDPAARFNALRQGLEGGQVPLSPAMQKSILDVADDRNITDQEIDSFLSAFVSPFLEPETFTGATRALDAQGNPVLLERGSRSGMRPIEGFAPPPQSGQSIEVDADGNVRIYSGPGAGVSKPTRTSIEKELVDLGDNLSQLNLMRQSFRPEFQQLGTRFEAAFISGKAKLGMDITPQDRADLEAFASWRADARNLQATVINALSGAAVSEAEAKRLNGFLIDPGKGLFDGDDHITAETKMNRLEEATRRAIARRNFMLSKGIALTDKQFDAIPLASMPAVIDQRSSELMNQISSEQPEMPAGEVRALVSQKLREEFGL